jgi:hypothetical protein
MRYLRKREMLAYYLLVTSGGAVEYGEALDLLKNKLCLSPKIGRSVLKKLRNSGYISMNKKDDAIYLNPRPLSDVFNSLISEYSAQRCMKQGLT